MPNDEPTSLMDPLSIGETRARAAGLDEIAFDLTKESVEFAKEVPAPLVKPLARLVRSMNCYYSNLIEGNDTHPISIERAMREDFEDDGEKRNLQKEARAHVTVQEWIDETDIADPFDPDFLREIHRRFYQNLPPELLFVVDKETGERIRIVPGAFRNRHVAVGRHVPIAAESIPRFLDRYRRFYADLPRFERIQAMGAAHHRLVWIHPFLDGNGRVSRLASHAFAKNVLGSRSLWSIARGLARRVQDYKSLLANADATRRNDLDGRGHLSEERLLEFSRFYLDVCRDQIAFMRNLMRPMELGNRIASWSREKVAKNELTPHAPEIMYKLSFLGEIKPSEIEGMRGVSYRTTRRIVNELTEKRLVTQSEPGAPIVLNFSAEIAEAWFPKLFPDMPSQSLDEKLGSSNESSTSSVPRP